MLRYTWILWKRVQREERPMDTDIKISVPWATACGSWVILNPGFAKFLASAGISQMLITLLSLWFLLSFFHTR